jgi:sugar lactone lactonase YvrE
MDSQILYATDSSRGTVYILQVGTRAPRILNRIPRVSGEPRGLAVDATGRLWVALYDGWSIARLSPEGEFDRITALPVPRPTGIAFGGEDGQSIFVTTARVGLPRDVLDNAPLSGRLLVVRPTSTPPKSTSEKQWRRARSKHQA